MVGGDSSHDLDRDRVLASQRKRWEFLRYLYEANQKLPAGRIQSEYAFDVGNAIGVTDRREADRIFTYLKDAGLIRFMTMGPTVCITRAGIDAVERALAEPERPTTFFAPINLITVTGGIHAPIQQGTHSSTQTIESAAVDWAGLQAILPMIRTAVETLGLSTADVATASADLQTVEAQSKSPSPRAAVVRECLLSLRSVFETAGESISAEGISAWLKAQGWL